MNKTIFAINQRALVQYHHFIVLILVLFITCVSTTIEAKTRDISHIISKEAFENYQDVGEFIDDSPKVTIIVQPEQDDIEQYGQQVMKSLTGSDCDRDGKMDDNATCNAVYLKLWLKYKR